MWPVPWRGSSRRHCNRKPTSLRCRRTGSRQRSRSAISRRSSLPGSARVTYENRYQGDAATGRFLPSGAENLLPSLRNSLTVGAWVAILNLLVSITAAYAIAKIHFRGRQTALYSILVTRVIPDIALIVPLFLMIRNLGPHQHASR